MIEPAPLQQVDRTYVLAGSRRLTYFAGCDYLRMSSHPKVISALDKTARRTGLNVAASRMTTGNHVLYQELEKAIARFFRAETATLVQTGYLTNFVAAQAMAGQFSHAFIDSACHPALKDAAQFLNCPILSLPSRDTDALAALVRRCGTKSRPLLMTDGMFARDGSVAPLKTYLRLLPRDAMLLVDDAHGGGVVGRHGGGSVDHCGVSRKNIIQTITLSKAFGVYGGAVLGDDTVRRRIMDHSSVFVGSTPLPLPLAGAAITSIKYIRAHPELRERMHRNASRLKARLRKAGYDLPDMPGPVFGLAAQTEAVTRRVKRALLANGVFPSLIRYPGTPEGGVFRFVISCAHTSAQLNSLAAALEQFSPGELKRV